MSVVKKGLFHILFLLVTMLPGQAQKPGYYLGFDHILDNREYHTDYGRSQTIFGVRINPGAYITFNSVHQIHAGFNYMYEFGGKLLGVTPQIDLYYSYQSEKIDLFLGAFPRRDLVNYPLMMLADTIKYYRPNIEGVSIGYHNEWASVHVWVDWISKVSDDIRESVLAGADIKLQSGAFYLKGITTRGHLARTTSADDKNHVRNEGSLLAMIGVDLAELCRIERFDLSSGWISTFLHTYPAVYDWNHGWLSQLDIRKGMFGVVGSWYMGDPSTLVFGDRLYGHGDYGRIDFYFDPFRNPHITSKIGWNLHWLPGDGLYHSQQLLVRINL